MTRFQQHAERFDTELIFDQIHTVKLDARLLHLIGATARTPATR
jgi:thioredoxin reductase (NADPH)